MKIKRGGVLLICIIWLLILLLVVIVYALTSIRPTCKDVEAISIAGTLVRTCGNISLRGDNPNQNITIRAASDRIGNLTVNYTGGTIPAGQTINSVCVNFTILSISSDNAIANCLNVTLWKASASNYFSIQEELTTPPDAYTTYSWCNDTIITTVDDANALKVRFTVKGDATASEDPIAFDYISVEINYSAPANPPTINNVSIETSQSITEGNKKTINFSFIATDPQGVADLDDASVRAFINRTQGTLTTNYNISSCTWVADIGQTANYSCSVDIWYWDMNGSWTLNVSIADTGGLIGRNTTKSFTLGSTASIQIAPNAINFGTLQINKANNTATDDPILINNTGNLNVTAGNVRVKAIDLAGADTKTIAAGNFSVGITTGGTGFEECNKTASGNANQMVNNTATQITKAGLGRGNLSSPLIASYQEQLYFCFWYKVPDYITWQQYTTTAPAGSWTIDII